MFASGDAEAAARLLHGHLRLMDSASLARAPWARQRILRDLSRIELYQQNFTAAWTLLYSAQKGGKLRTGEWLYDRCDWFLAQKDCTNSLQLSIVLSINSSKTDGTLATANAVQRIGDSFFYTSLHEDLDVARSCYEATLGWIRHLGMWRHLADCLLRLGMVDYVQGFQDRAIKRLNQARKFYVVAESVEGARYCEARAIDCVEGTSFVSISLLYLVTRL
jgi:hypothetical protein